MSAHARRSPSAADRWGVCAPSVRLIERLIADGIIDPNESSPAADEGTAAHHFRDLALTMGMDASAFIGCTHTVNGVAYLCDDEMARHLQRGLDWLNKQSGEMIVEHRVDLNRWLEGDFGRLDTAIIDRAARRLTVFDLKYGANIDVEVEGNRQLRIYALGILDNFDLWDAIDEILIVIDQPRCGGFKTWPITIQDLREFGPEIQSAGYAVDDPNAPLVYSEKGCLFCPVKTSPDGCPAYDAHLVDMLPDDIDDLPDARYMDPALRWQIIRNTSKIKKWLDDLERRSLMLSLMGKPDPGSTHKPGPLADRRFTDPQAAEDLMVYALGVNAYTRKLKSPAQAEKDLAPKRGKPGNPLVWNALNALITRDEGQPILVPDAADAVDELEDFD